MKSKDSARDQSVVLDLYKKMYLVRRCEEKIQEEYFNDEMKTPVHLSIGAEAISAAVIASFPDSMLFGTYRNHAMYLIKTNDIDGFFAELYGKATGVNKGKAGSMHLMNPAKGVMCNSAIVGSTIPVATGAAFAKKYKKESEYTVVFFGDGATEEGCFWESANFARLHNLNILFVCEDNSLAIHAPPTTRKGLKSIVNAITSFDLTVQSGDGRDVLLALDSVTEIQKKLKQVGGGPAFLHLTYDRFLEHVGPLEDFKFGYRKVPENHKTVNDPIWNLEQKFKELGVDLSEVEKIKTDIDARISVAITKAKAAPFPSPQETVSDVYYNGES